MPRFTFLVLSTITILFAASSLAGQGLPMPARVYKVGGDVKVPVAVQRPAPTLPDGAKCRPVVFLDTIVNETGAVVRVTDVSRPPDAFTSAYAKAAYGWRFRPATMFGRPVAVQFACTVSAKCK